MPWGVRNFQKKLFYVPVSNENKALEISCQTYTAHTVFTQFNTFNNTHKNQNIQ